MRCQCLTWIFRVSEMSKMVTKLSGVRLVSVDADSIVIDIESTHQLQVLLKQNTLEVEDAKVTCHQFEVQLMFF